MVKRTLYFGNPARLHISSGQLIVTLSDSQEQHHVPIADVGYAILDHPQITLTHAVLRQFQAYDIALVCCDEKHHPASLMLPLDANSLQNERFRSQVEASVPLQKQLWRQTVKQKILNQAEAIAFTNAEVSQRLKSMAGAVKSGDSTFYEGQAAALYWKHFFPTLPNFTRERDGEAPNHLLNYGYAILRAILARAIVTAGLHPTLGIHHANRYNAYCLADDLMEPYRPFVDTLVQGLLDEEPLTNLISKRQKAALLAIPAITVTIDGDKSPLMIAASRTAVSLVKCFEGSIKKILYPQYLR